MIRTLSFSGPLYRCVPRIATDPLSGEFARRKGGRWNAPGRFGMLYTFLDPSMARRWLDVYYAHAGLTLADVQPEELPDLVILACVSATVVDLLTDGGLEAVGLPPTYPLGHETEAAYVVTQPIGARLHAARYPGLITRSAAAAAWSGPRDRWAELAFFTDHAAPPAIVERRISTDWLI